MKKTYSIFEAKARLSEIIRTVRQKHEVIITDRSKPVVRVVPVEDERSRRLEERVENLTRLGQLSLPRPIKSNLKQHPMPHGTLKEFLEERE